MLATGPFNELGYGYEFDDEAKAGRYTIGFEALAARLSALDAAARRNGSSITKVIFDRRSLPKLFAAPGGGIRLHPRDSLHPMDPAHLTPSAEYLNVDLEVRSRSNLAPLAEALSEKLFVLHVVRIPGGFLAAFETGGPTLRPDVAVRRCATVIGALKDPARKLWLDAYDRVFDFGLEHTTGRGIGAIGLSRETVRLMASLNARVAVSIYPRARPGRARASVAPGRRRRGDAPAKS